MEIKMPYIFLIIITLFFEIVNADELEKDEFYLPAIGKQLPQQSHEIDATSCWNEALDNEGIKNCHSRLFIDLDFDGTNEIIEINFRAGQRHRHTYTIYQHHGLEMQGNQLRLMNFPPFNQIDSATIFNKRDKTIKIQNSGGACIFEEKIYKKVSDEWRVVKLISADLEDQECVIKTYEWNEESGLELVQA